MSKLTAGIFAGILTIVSVNAADAAIASKAYVDDLDKATNALVTKNAGNITTLKTTVEGNTTNITALQGLVGDETKGLVADVAALQESVGENGSVADQIADSLKGYTTTTDMNAALDLKADKTALASTDANVKTNADAIVAMQDETKGILATANAYTDELANGAVKTNTDNISGLTTKIGNVTEGKTVVQMISDATSAASDNVDEKLGDLGDNETVAEALAEKVDVNAGVASQMITTDANGQITALPVTEGSNGTYVLTATVAGDKATYYWELIQRGQSASTPSESSAE